MIGDGDGISRLGLEGGVRTVRGTLDDAAASASSFLRNAALDGDGLQGFSHLVSGCASRRGLAIEELASGRGSVGVTLLGELAATVRNESLDVVIDFVLQGREVDLFFAHVGNDEPLEEAGLIVFVGINFTTVDVLRHTDSTHGKTEATDNENSDGQNDEEREGEALTDGAEGGDGSAKSNDSNKNGRNRKAEEGVLGGVDVIVDLVHVIDEGLHVLLDIGDLVDSGLEIGVGGVKTALDSSELVVNPVSEASSTIGDGVDEGGALDRSGNTKCSGKKRDDQSDVSQGLSPEDSRLGVHGELGFFREVIEFTASTSSMSRAKKR